MIPFSPRDPYPLISDREPTHLEAQSHAVLVDRWLRLRTEEVERRLSSEGTRSKAHSSNRDSQKLWFGLDVQSLLTPYVDLRAALANLGLRSGQKVVDLGAAYGRLAFVIEREHPGVEFLGYEYVGERVREGRRCFDAHDLVRSRLEHADLSAIEFSPEPADVYFIYDYGTPKAIEKTLHDLRRIARLRPVILVARGRLCRYAIESKHTWLTKSDLTRGEGRVTIYRSADSGVFIEAAV